jgi:hypothetical protein
LKAFWNILIWIGGGSLVSVADWFSAMILFGIGHGSSLFWQIYSAPSPYGAVVPLLLGALMTCRHKVWAVSVALAIELTHFTSCFFGIWKTGVDRYYLVNTVEALPAISLMSFGIYLSWHIVIIVLSTKTLLRRSSFPHSLAHR